MFKINSTFTVNSNSSSDPSQPDISKEHLSLTRKQTAKRPSVGRFVNPTGPGDYNLPSVFGYEEKKIEREYDH